MKIVSIEEISQRIKERFPEQPFKIIQYKKVTSPIIIQCLKCNKISTYSNCNNFLNIGNKSKKYLCSCYNKNNNINKHNINKEKIIQLCKDNENIEFLSFDYREKVKKYSVNVLCKKCNQIFNKDWTTFLNNQTCPYCYSKHNMNTLGFKAILPKDYELISNYDGTEKKVLIKHECGFIWNIKPHNFIQKINNGYSGCPQCNHKHSQGEIKIANWLKEKDIKFIEQQTFLWSSNHRFRYDFFLPKYNLIIEYMGAQHYKEVNFFHDTLADRQERDRIKEEEAKKQGIEYLIISYIDFKNIETILQDWFNDYPEKE